MLEVALIALEDAFREERDAAAHLRKIRRWLESCWRSAGQGSKRRLSAEVLRRIELETAVADEVRLSVIGRDWTVDAWAAWLVALDALLLDILCTWEGGRASCWRYLGQTWDTWVRQFLRQAADPGRAEENGTAMYLGIVERTGWM